MLAYCGATDTGGRENNEDAYITMALECRHLYLFAVADGLGGHAAGEVASMLAVTELAETVKKDHDSQKTASLESMKELLAVGFKRANEKICHEAKNVPGRYGMGTTLVAALLNDEGRGVVANVGDSRAYKIGETIKRITKDHSYVQELVDRGLISEEQAFRHPAKNIVTRVMGMENTNPDFYEIKLGRDTLLLCSDGLNDTMRDEEIREVVSGTVSLENKCKNLVSAALSRGARDNVTLLLLCPAF